MVDKSLSSEITRLSRLLNNNPHSRLFVPLAKAYLQADMPEEAIAVLSNGIKLNPSFVAAFVMLGKIFLRKKNFSEAKSQFEHVIGIAPKNIPSLKGLATIYREEGFADKARERYQTILKIDPMDKEADGLLKVLKVLDEKTLDPFESQKIFPPSEGHKIFPPSEGKESLATQTLASIYMKQGCYREAVEIYGKLLKRDPTDLASQKGLDEALLQLPGDSKASRPTGNDAVKKRTIGRLQRWVNVIQREKRR